VTEPGSAYVQFTTVVEVKFC